MFDMTSTENWWRYATAREQGNVQTQLFYLDQMVDEVIAQQFEAEGTEITRDEAREYLRELEQYKLETVAR
jgi:threonyl-tRNA synthetase